MRTWTWGVALTLGLLAAVVTALAWLFGTNRYVWMGEGEYCDLDSPALIRGLAVFAVLLTLAGTAIGLSGWKRLRPSTRGILALVVLALLVAASVRWGQATAAERQQVAAGCAGASRPAPTL